MILQFPTPYPDELLYSVFARYHMRSGNVFLKHTMEDLFGKRTVSATAFLPSNIHSLVSLLPENTTLNEQVLVERHSMYPFYTSLLPLETAQSVYQDMLSDNGKNIYMQSGIMASAIPQNKVFKFCPRCFQEDLDQYSELFWHRLHQLPGHFVCLKHGLWLEDSIVPIINSNKHTYILPTADNCDLIMENTVEESIHSQYTNFIRQIECLLNGSYERKSYDHFTDFYRKYLIEKGFVSVNGHVYQSKLQKSFRNFYSDSFLKNIGAEMKHAESWLTSITRKHRKSFHPYYHILLLNFLGLEVDDVFNLTSLKIEPFGRPNWACLNVVCPDFKKDTIEEVSIRRCEKTKKPIGRFTCPTCGFSYTRKDLTLNVQNRYKYTRIMEFGPIWKEELRFLLERDLSFREIARRLNVDTNTVIKYEKVINGEFLLYKIESNQNKNELIEVNRQVWLHLQNEQPKLSKTELRSLKPSTFTFLYRHDNEWLNKNSPTITKRKIASKRVNWQERDKNVLKMVQKATNELLNRKENWKRITIKSLGDSIGERALIEQHLDKMPKTKKFIEEVSETEKEYRKRRVIRVIEEMNETDEGFRAWKVLRRSGIKKAFYSEVIELIKSLSNT
jgi:transposase-like protein